jgi:hypothetical protein
VLYYTNLILIALASSRNCGGGDLERPDRSANQAATLCWLTGRTRFIQYDDLDPPV